MTARKTTICLALEALSLAAECGGELHQKIYEEAKEKLQALVDEVAEYDLKMDTDERVPEGDDYNELMSIIRSFA